jgi:hypothetical protein
MGLVSLYRPQALSLRIDNLRSIHQPRFPASPLPRFPASPLPRFPAAPLPHVLTFASKTSPANKMSTLGAHAAAIGLITPPAPTAFMI